MYAHVCMYMYDMYVHVCMTFVNEDFSTGLTVFTIILYFPIDCSTLGFWL